MLIALYIAFVWALACLLFDSYYTNKGIKAGVAVEGNSMIVYFFNNKPKFWQLWAVDGTLRLAIFAAARFLPAPTDYPFTWVALGLGALIAAGFKNIQGGRQWLWMFKNPGKKIPLMNTLWSKIMGFWG